MATCPKCARGIPDDRQLCMYCGAPLVPPVACPSCGHLVPAHLKNCQYCRAALGGGPVPQRAADFLEQGRTFVQTGRLAEAVEAFDRAIKLSPQWAEPWTQKAAALAGLDKKDEAYAAIEKAIALEPSDSGKFRLREARRRIGQIGRQSSQAIARVTTVDVVKRAEELCERGQYQEALTALDSVLATLSEKRRTMPELAGLLTQRGVCLDALGRRDEAIAEYEKALAVHPNYGPALARQRPILESPDLAYERGLSLEREGRPNEAMAAFIAAVRAAPTHAAAWERLGRVRADAGDHHGALACFDTVLSMEDTRETKTAKLGAQVALPRTLDALSAAQATVPEEAVALANEGRALGKEGRTEDALILLERALAVARGYGRAWIDRGACLMLLRRYDEAIVSFDRAMTLDPRARAVCLQNKGQCLGDLKRSDEALRCYEEAVGLAPESAILWFLRGEMERQVGDGERATRSLTHFVSLATTAAPRFSRELERAQRWLSQAEQPGKADV